MYPVPMAPAPRLRIFSYLPNPRVWKSVIAARLGGVDLEIRGAPPAELAEWLWDFDARPLTPEERSDGTHVVEARRGFRGKLHKTPEFLEANPFGTVPVAFSPDGTGIFESNSMLRAVARLGTSDPPLYGTDVFEASRIDSFLDVSLTFGRDTQIYLLALGRSDLDPAIRDRALEATEVYLGGIERALSPDRAALVGRGITLADISFACELALFSRERLQADDPIFHPALAETYPRALAHFERLCAHEAFKPELGPYMAKLG